MEGDDPKKDVYYIGFKGDAHAQRKEECRGYAVHNYIEEYLSDFVKLVFKQDGDLVRGKRAAMSPAAGASSSRPAKKSPRTLSPQEQVIDDLEKVLLPRFRNLLKTPRRGYDMNGRSEPREVDSSDDDDGEIDSEEDVLMCQQELSKRFEDKSACVFISRAFLVEDVF